MSQPEVRVSPDGGKIAVRWLPDQTMTWQIVDAADLKPSSLEPDDTVEGWQPLVPLAEPADEVEHLRQRLHETHKAHGIDKGRLHIEENLHGHAKERIRQLEADIESRWQNADVKDAVKSELARRTADLDVWKAALHDTLDNWKQVQSIGLTRLGLRLGFYPHDLDAALERQAREIQQLKAELEQLRGEAGEPE